jgi:hypothetical protein
MILTMTMVGVQITLEKERAKQNDMIRIRVRWLKNYLNLALVI